MTRNSLQLVLAAILFLPVAATGQQEEQEEPKLSFNFREARVETVLKYVCEQLGWTYVFENASAPSKGTITAISDGEISPEQALVLLDTSLRQHGLATLNPYAPRMPRKGETIKIVTVKDAMKKNLEVRFGSDPDKIAPTDKVITQIIPLKGANVGSVQKELGDIIKSCLAPDGTFSIDSYSNSLVMTGRSEGIRRAALILKVIDVEAVQFAVSGKVHPGVALGGEYDAGCVDERLLVWVGGEPIGNGIGPDGGDLDAWCAHNKKIIPCLS